MCEGYISGEYKNYFELVSKKNLAPLWESKLGSVVWKLDLATDIL